MTPDVHTVQWEMCSASTWSDLLFQQCIFNKPTLFQVFPLICYSYSHSRNSFTVEIFFLIFCSFFPFWSVLTLGKILHPSLISILRFDRRHPSWCRLLHCSTSLKSHSCAISLDCLQPSKRFNLALLFKSYHQCSRTFSLRYLGCLCFVEFQGDLRPKRNSFCSPESLELWIMKLAKE